MARIQHKEKKHPKSPGCFVFCYFCYLLFLQLDPNYRLFFKENICLKKVPWPRLDGQARSRSHLRQTASTSALVAKSLLCTWRPSKTRWMTSWGLVDDLMEVGG